MIAIMDIDECLVMFRDEKNEIMLEAVRRCQNGEHWSTAWAEWNATNLDDVINPEICRVYDDLVDAGYDVLVVSARGVANAEVTETFFQRWGLTYTDMILRAEAYEGMGSAAYKELVINEYLASRGLTWADVAVAVDDSKSNLDMFARYGVTVVAA